MRYRFPLLFSAAIFLCTVGAGAKTIYFSALNRTIALADSSLAVTETLKSDEYTKSLTAFDLAIRLDSDKPLTEKDYLNLAARDVQDWSAGQQEKIIEAFKDLEAYTQRTGISLNLPDTIIMIKTTARAEFGAEGWTRANRIMLNPGAQPISLHLVAHELFHVLSRHDPKTRDALYAVFGFRPTNNLDYKKALNNQVITNPDCPFVAHCTTVDVNGKPADVTLLLYSKNGYRKGGGMEDYAAIGVLELTGDDKNKKPLLRDGKPVIHEIPEVPGLFKKIGTNTQYILHVEEISAEHFATLAGGDDFREPAFGEAFERVLQGK